MDCPDEIVILVAVALLACLSTLILIVAIILLLWKPHFFHRMLKRKVKRKSSQVSRDYSRVDSVSPPKLAAERGTDTLTPPAASTSHTPLPAIQEVEEKSYPVRLVDRGTQTEAGFESSEEKHGPSNSAAGSNTGSQTRRRSRGRRSSLANSLSKLGIGRRSCDQDSEEGFDLMAAAEIEGSPSGDEEKDTAKDSVFQPLPVSGQQIHILDLHFDQGESSV